MTKDAVLEAMKPAAVKPSVTRLSIIDAILDKKLFKPWFDSPTWNNWVSFLKVLFALPLDQSDRATFRKHTQRATVPTTPFREAWLVVGRRGGKSLVASLIAVFLACFKDYSNCLKRGEIGTVILIASDRRQARTLMRYCKAFFALPILRSLLINETAQSLELSNNIVIEIHTASFRSVRGYSCVACVLDEIAYFRTDESATPDSELVKALRPAMATIPDSLLLAISSPYSRRGELWNQYLKHFGKDSPTLIWQASSRSMNPSLSQSIVDKALEEDESAARAEYYAEFRSDLESFVSREAVDACTVQGRLELPPVSGIRYTAFVDPSGGSNDSMTLAIAHREKDTAILDCLRERKAPFSPDDVCKEFSETLKTYGISTVTGDRYGGEFPRERLRVHGGITYKCSEKPKSEIYLAFLPALNAQRCELLDNKRLHSQLLNLERRTARSGRDSVDHPPMGHDDLINAAAGAIVSVQAGREIIFGSLGGAIYSTSSYRKQTEPQPEPAPRGPVTRRESPFYKRVD